MGESETPWRPHSPAPSAVAGGLPPPPASISCFLCAHVQSPESRVQSRPSVWAGVGTKTPVSHSVQAGAPFDPSDRWKALKRSFCYAQLKNPALINKALSLNKNSERRVTPASARNPHTRKERNQDRAKQKQPPATARTSKTCFNQSIYMRVCVPLQQQTGFFV